MSIWASEPIGSARPRFTSSTPAMSVEATAPRPTVRTPRRPSAGRTLGEGGVVTVREPTIRQRDGDPHGWHGAARRAARGPAGAHRGRRVAPDLPGHGARRRRPAEPALRAQQAAQATAIGMSRARDLPAMSTQAKVEAPVPSSRRTPTSTASSSRARCRPGSTPTRCSTCPAGEGRRRADRALAGPARARRARPRRVHAARRDAPARALRRRDVRPAGRRDRPHARSSGCRSRCCSPARGSTPRSRWPTAAPPTWSPCAGRPTSSSPPPGRRT